MSGRKIIVVIFTILSGIDMGLLWIGGGASVAQVSEQASTPITQTGALDLETPPVIVEGVVEIRPPDSLVDELTAAGAIELVSKQQVVLAVDGIVSQVAVRVGDQVAAGDLLLALDTTELERALGRAQLDLETAQAELAKLHETGSPGEIAVAEANLRAAQENLVKVQAGATADEIAAAQSKLSAANAKYNELLAPPSSAELDEVKAELEKADIERQNAQREYDKIKWRNDKGMTAESAALYKATVEYERVQAKFDRLNQASAQSSVQDSVSSIQKAQSELLQLQQRPTAAELAEAEAKVADAEEKLAKLSAGPSTATLQSAEAKVRKAQLDLEEAQTKLNNAHVLAPIAGTVLEMPIAAGERGTVGKVVSTLADTSQLRLNVKVAEVDIPRITLGQQASIAIDAIRGRTFAGVVESIAPINQSDKDVVNYPVTIRLTDTALEGVKPGMNAVATLGSVQPLERGWLAPTSALRKQADGQTVVMVLRGDMFTPVVVQPGEAQGEWTLVRSAELQAGDRVQGSVASYVDEQATPGTAGE